MKSFRKFIPFLDKRKLQMSHINVDPKFFFYQGDKVSGRLKTYPEDFIVVELKEKDSVPRFKLNFDNFDYWHQEDTVVSVPIESSVEDAFNVVKYLGNDTIDMLIESNKWIELSNFAESKPIRICLPAERANRTKIHEYLRNQFPFISAVSGKKLSNPCEEDDSSAIYIIPDRDFLGLTEFGVSMSDIKTLCKYRKFGAGHSDAGLGCLIGKGLDRNQRTLLYQHLSTNFPSFGFRTVDIVEKKRKFDDNTEFSSPSTDLSRAQVEAKCIAVYWKSKSRQKLNCVNPVLHSERGSMMEIRPVTVHLSFMLFKYNVEQFAALKIIVDILKNRPIGQNVVVYESATNAVSPLNNLSPSGSMQIAGIKDKLAVTVQSTTLAVTVDANYINEQLSKMLKKGEISSNSLPVGKVITTLLTEIVEKFKGVNNWLMSSACNENNILDKLHSGRSVSRIAIGNLELVKKPIMRGELWGNKFKIRIRNLNCNAQVSNEQLSIILKNRIECMQKTGFPNYFGSQRMGDAARHWLSPTQSSTIEDTEFADTVEDVDIVSDSKPSPELNLSFDNIRAVNILSKEEAMMALGAFIGKCLLKNRYKDVLDSIIMGFPCSISHVMSNDLDSPSVNTEYNLDYLVYDINHYLKSVETSIRDETGVHNLLFTARQIYSFSLLHSSTDSDKCRDAMLKVVQYLPYSALRERMVVKSLIRFGQQNMEKVINDGLSYASRNLYISAYQSWIWNSAACFRLKDQGSVEFFPIIGDLMKDNAFQEVCRSETNHQKDLLQKSRETIRILSGEDIAILKQCMDNNNRLEINKCVLLPMVGKGCIFPQNSTGEFLKNMLSKDGFVDETGRVALSCGSAYRNIIQQFEGDIQITEEISSENHPQAPEVYLDSIGSNQGVEIQEETASCGAIISLQLPSGSYATSALRELLHNNDFI